MSNRKMAASISAALSIVAAADSFAYDPNTADQLPTVQLNNGIYSVEVNGNGSSGAPYPHYPGITRISVLGTTFIPFDNAGASMQFSVRSSAGDPYNPTIEGDCANRPSQVTGMLFQASGAGYTGNWVPAGLPNRPQDGALMGVTPLQYVASNSQCPQTGLLTPYNMNMGVSLGSGSLPLQAMIIDMAVQKTSAAATDLAKNYSELPVAYGYLNRMQFAYYSTDLQTFQPANAYFSGSAPTNDISTWPIASNTGGSYLVQTDPNIAAAVSVPTPSSYGTNLPAARILMLCDAAAVLPSGGLNMSGGTCMALYSEYPTMIYLSRRQSYSALTLMAMGNVQVPGRSTVISDTNWHALRRLMVVGNPATILNVVNLSRPYVDGYSSTW